jgi:hypothetical protein
MMAACLACNGARENDTVEKVRGVRRMDLVEKEDRARRVERGRRDLETDRRVRKEMEFRTSG